MIITFCGHAQFYRTEEYERKIMAFLEEKAENKSVDIYLGGYGEFDCFAYDCCKKYKETHENVSLVFVSPYLSVEYQRNHLEYQKKKYDSILYPELEKIPPRFAIIYRNRYMVDNADYVVAYVSHTWGGAYTTYKYAKRKGKNIYNVAHLEE